MSRLRIAFLGLPLAAILLSRDGHEICFAGICREDGVGLRRLRRRIGEERVIMKPNLLDPSVLDRVRKLSPDLLVSWFWTKRIPMDYVRAARLGGFGVHPSLLPRHRGPDPTYWTILCGDKEAGVTAHRIESDYDTGDILASSRIAVGPTWTAWQLARALDRPSLRLLRDTTLRFARGEEIRGTAQDEVAATEAPFPSDEACAIRWVESTRSIERQIRALSPAPGAFTEVNGKLLAIIRARPAREVPRVLAPGEAAVQHGAIVVRTGDGAIEILEAEVDGSPTSQIQLQALFSADHA